MKKLQAFLIVTLLLSLTSLKLSAQPMPAFWLGARVGMDVGTVSLTPSPASDESISSVNGIAIGGQFDYWFSEHLGISGQPMYVQKGFHDDFNSSSTLGQFSSIATISYLEIPILLKATVGSGSLKPVFFVGPAIGFKLSAKQRSSSNGFDTTVDIPDTGITSTNFSLVAGVGATYMLNPTTMLFLDVAYDYGLSDLNPHGNGTNSNQTGNTRDYRISLGILFGLGGEVKE
jgi:hypothetical protein